jgi:hypothetical protein
MFVDIIRLPVLPKTPSCLYFKTQCFGDWILWISGPEIGTSPIDWAQLSEFYLKTETESSLRNVMFLNINITVC